MVDVCTSVLSTECCFALIQTSFRNTPHRPAHYARAREKGPLLLATSECPRGRHVAHREHPPAPPRTLCPRARERCNMHDTQQPLTVGTGSNLPAVTSPIGRGYCRSPPDTSLPYRAGLLPVPTVTSRQWACHENVVSCPEGFFFTADRSGTKSPLDSPLDSAVQRETVIVSQNDSSKRLLFDSANDESAKRFLFCRSLDLQNRNPTATDSEGVSRAV